MRLSVCTVASGRRAHLVNLIHGLRRSPRPPAELVIAGRREELRELPPTSFPILRAVLPEEPLSLARGRNAAAARASGDILVFLDADCIANPRLLDDYAGATRHGGLLMGEIVDLPPGAAEQGLEPSRLEALAKRPGVAPAERPEAVEPIRDYRSFSAINFAIPARDFAAAGGFDERYLGEGGEDIDFSRAAMAAGLPFARLHGARAYRQHHRRLVPPVEQLDAILANAELFRSKWNQPVMEDWLLRFERMGLAEFTEAGWRKLREPDEQDMALAEAQAERPEESADLEMLARRLAGARKGSLRPAA